MAKDKNNVAASITSAANNGSEATNPKNVATEDKAKTKDIVPQAQGNAKARSRSASSTSTGSSIGSTASTEKQQKVEETAAKTQKTSRPTSAKAEQSKDGAQKQVVSKEGKGGEKSEQKSKRPSTGEKPLETQNGAEVKKSSNIKDNVASAKPTSRPASAAKNNAAAAKVEKNNAEVKKSSNVKDNVASTKPTSRPASAAKNNTEVKDRSQKLADKQASRPSSGANEKKVERAGKAKESDEDFFGLAALFDEPQQSSKKATVDVPVDKVKKEIQKFESKNTGSAETAKPIAKRPSSSGSASQKAEIQKTTDKKNNPSSTSRPISASAEKKVEKSEKKEKSVRIKEATESARDDDFAGLASLFDEPLEAPKKTKVDIPADKVKTEIQKFESKSAASADTAKPIAKRPSSGATGEMKTNYKQTAQEKVQKSTDKKGDSLSTSRPASAAAEKKVEKADAVKPATAAKPSTTKVGSAVEKIEKPAAASIAQTETKPAKTTSKPASRPTSAAEKKPVEKKPAVPNSTSNNQTKNEKSKPVAHPLTAASAHKLSQNKEDNAPKANAREASSTPAKKATTAPAAAKTERANAGANPAASQTVKPNEKKQQAKTLLPGAPKVQSNTKSNVTTTTQKLNTTAASKATSPTKSSHKVQSPVAGAQSPIKKQSRRELDRAAKKAHKYQNFKTSLAINRAQGIHARPVSRNGRLQQPVKA